MLSAFAIESYCLRLRDDARRHVRCLTTRPFTLMLPRTPQIRELPHREIHFHSQKSHHSESKQLAHAIRYQVIDSNASSLMKAVYMLRSASPPCNIPQAAAPMKSVKVTQIPFTQPSFSAVNGQFSNHSLNLHCALLLRFHSC